jgi:DNA repair protein RadC
MKNNAHSEKQHNKLSDKELLKSLLHVIRVKGDIDAISQSAIQEFGGFRETLAQGSEDLKKIKGFTPTIIKHLKVIYSLYRELMKPETYPTDIQSFGTLSYYFHTSPKLDGECLRMLFLDENQNLLKDFIFKKGSGNHVKFYFREIVKEVLRVGVNNLVIIHHKMGIDCQPDLIEKKRYRDYLAGFEALAITLHDYLIICNNSIFSFDNNKLYSMEA